MNRFHAERAERTLKASQDVHHDLVTQAHNLLDLAARLRGEQMTVHVRSEGGYSFPTELTYEPAN